MTIDDLACQGSQRLRLLRSTDDLHGIQCVHFRRSDSGEPELLVELTRYWQDALLKKVKRDRQLAPVKLENILIEGGRRIKDVRAVLVHRFENDESLGNVGTFRIRLNHVGDPSDYSLRLILSPDVPSSPPDGFDHQYAYAEFRFCTSGVAEEDCADDACMPASHVAPPPIDYVAKDYASFRRLMLDRLSQIVPNWNERNPADLGVTIVEALAYHADHLSYFQDAIATEAYLQTARRRLSVRRHARFIDYQLHEGCNARAWVFVKVNQCIPVERHWSFYTSPDTPFHQRANRPILTKGDLQQPCERDRIVFEPVTIHRSKPQMLHPELNLLHIYSWGNDECCLPQGATSATLCLSDIGDKIPLAAGDLLMFEEAKGPHTGLAADADPAHRHMVRLNRVVNSHDVIPGTSTRIPVAIVSWDTQDSLPFAFCISSGRNSNVCVARGNIVLVDHGLSAPVHSLEIPDSEVDPPLIDSCQSQPPRLPNASGATRRRRFYSVPLTLDNHRLTQAAPFPDRTIQARSQARQIARWLAEAHSGKALLRFLRAATGREHDELEARVLLVFIRANALLSRAESGLAISANDADVRAIQSQLEEFKTFVTEFESNIERKLSEEWNWDFNLNLIGPAAADLEQDPQLAVTAFQLVERVERKGERKKRWKSVRNLLHSGPEDRQFVLELDDGSEEGAYSLRFGDGNHGAAPWSGTAFECTFREGGGTAGNVGVDAIDAVTGDQGTPAGVEEVRNYFPAHGGVDPERTSDARFKAPQHFRSKLVRAVTAEDYARLAMLDERVNRAIADMCWTGTGYEVRVALDLYAYALQGADNPIQEEALIRHEVNQMLERYRCIGHEVLVVPTRYVPLLLELNICVKSHVQQGVARRAVRESLSNRKLSGGLAGYFHPDQLTFGQSINASSIVAQIQRVDGIDAVQLVELRRLFGPERVDVRGGTLFISPQEIARLDNDRAFPENGRLILNMRGGR